MVEAPGDAEGMREIGRADEEHVDALDRGDLVEGLEAALVLDLDDGREALVHRGHRLVATDADPPAPARVIRASAEEALRRYRQAVVLGCFVPIDAGVDRWVLGFPSVRHYVVLGARIGGMLGSESLWQEPGWTAEPIEDVTRWMLTRHDVWIDRRTTLRRGEAWHFEDKSSR